MTKFILHGGSTSKTVPSNRTFFAEMAKGLSGSVKILLVYFASEKKKWDSLCQDDQNKFSEAAPKKKLKFERASDETSEFSEQVKRADVIYVRGGENARLISKLKEIKDLKKLLTGKVYGGSSAGANAAAKYFYTRSKTSVATGLNLIPVKVFCHYEDKMSRELAALENFGKKVPLYKIPEAKFVVLQERF